MGAKVISVITQKGGVGKTTTVNALASCYHRKKYRVLGIDMDSQGNLSFSAGADNENNATIYDVMKGSVKPSFAVQHRDMCDIIPANIVLSSIELEYTGANREYLLRNAVTQLRDLYDYIFIDAPPGLGMLTVNSLTASDYVIIPMLPDIFSLQGLALVHETIEHIKKNLNPRLQIAGIMINKFNARSRLGNEIIGTAEMISENLGIPIFDTKIRNSIALSEAQSLQYDCTKYSRYATGVKDYMSLCEELIAKNI
ncbi:MAG: AAA family ATPase [Oscillospiraceae bacterium]|jgi:chromosome partitioning protein|nr:AAA family ATPase [Oscillospiraceae bacterium]